MCSRAHISFHMLYFNDFTIYNYHKKCNSLLQISIYGVEFILDSSSPNIIEASVETSNETSFFCCEILIHNFGFYSGNESKMQEATLSATVGGNNNNDEATKLKKSITFASMETHKDTADIQSDSTKIFWNGALQQQKHPVVVGSNRSLIYFKFLV